MTPTLQAELRAHIEAVRRLTPNWRDPSRFYVRRDEIANALADAFAQVLARSPCAACPAAALRRDLALARRERDTERGRRSEAERLLRSAVRKPRRSRVHALASQLDLWEREP